MKNVIMYYYNFDNISIYRWKDKKIIKYRNEIYLFQKIYNEEEIVEIYNLLKQNPHYHQFILNRNNSLFTIYNGNKYVLLKKVSTVENLERDILKREYITNNKYGINRSNWYFLWCQKNDYFEYQMNHIYGKFMLIDESIDYYIGMAETAISYINYNDISLQPNLEGLTICHKRINKDDFYNPINMILDYKERDIAEYLKYIFFHENYNKQKIEFIIKNSGCTLRGYYRIYGRLLYPSYYFDLYEQIINGKKEEVALKEVIERVDEYENYLNIIYQIIIKREGIKKIDWIQKKI